MRDTRFLVRPLHTVRFRPPRSKGRTPSAKFRVSSFEVRIVGVISAEQIEEGKKEANDRLLGVAIHSYVELSRFLRQPVKTQFSLNGELCYGIVSPNVHA